MTRHIQTTLLFIIKDGKILLGEKKRGFATGIFNGIGGKLENGESVEEAFLRETMEEIGVVPFGYQKVATIYCKPLVEGELDYETMHIFVANNYSGNVKESEEMRPCWFELDKIPYQKMFPDDRLWFDKVLNGERFTAYLTFDNYYKIVESKFINED